MQEIIARLESEKGYVNLHDLLCMNLNRKARAELFLYKYNSVDRVMKLMGPYIDETKVDGRYVRSTRREMMKQVLAIFYRYLVESKHAQVSPSLMTIAHLIDPTLEKIEDTDDNETKARKQKALHKMEMAVQRTVMSLQKMGLIRIVQYYKDAEHLNSYKSPCNFYIITPPSTFFPKTFGHMKKMPTTRRPMRTKLIQNAKIVEPTVKKTIYISYLDHPEQPHTAALEVLMDEKKAIKRRKVDEFLKANFPEQYKLLQEEKRLAIAEETSKAIYANEIKHSQNKSIMRMLKYKGVNKE